MSGPPQSEKPASAAAMDALDLDDLFLEGDDGPSLFEDMEIDLGDMGNIFDAPSNVAASSGLTAASFNNVGGGNVLAQEFGRQNSTASQGKRDRKRVRTAKTNPHLLAAAEQEGSESAQKRQSAIQKELQRLQDSSDVTMFGDTTNSKRKRRRSKKNQEHDDETNKHKDKEGESAGKVASKKKRRNSSKVTNTQQLDAAPTPQTTAQQPQLQQQQQALQQIFHQMKPDQQERLKKKAEAMGLNIFAASSSTSPTMQSQLSQGNLIHPQYNINDCGLKPSTTFYPFCALPPELDIKRGQRVFPVLEKINATSAPTSHHHHNNNTDDNQSSLNSSISTNITASSPLFTLFHQHLGLIQNSDRGISDLAEAVKLTHTSMTKEGGKKRMAQELSKLLAQCLKQSVFIKQNLSNLESFVKGEGKEGRWSDADIQSLFPDQKSKASTSSAAASSSLTSGVGINNTDKTSQTSKRGTSNASTNGGPTISVRVKVRVPGWRDKSGARLVAKLSCPPGWKAAMNRENLKAEAKLKASSSEHVPPPPPTTTTTTTTPTSTTSTKSSTSRKRKAKESSASTTPATNKSAVSAGPTSKIAIPFVSAVDSVTPKQGQEHQDSSILHNLYTKILRPSVSPSQRRELLASEISSTLSKLENARLTQQWTRARKLQVQMKALQSVYKDDIDIVPDMCNTIGMWRWMEHTNYFKDIEGEEEVYQELKDCLHERKEEEMFESKGRISEEGTLWGSTQLSDPRRVSTSSSSMDGNEDDRKDGDGLRHDIEPTPLFDRLQSLLVEVDGSDDEDDDDDDGIASLPQFSSDQFINGPAGDNHKGDMKLIDVSALTLDQRTYIQLRAAGLIDSKIPPSSVLKGASNAAASTSEKEGESIDLILKKMKIRLSHLQSDSNNSKVTALQRMALCHVEQAPERKQREREEDSILTKYKQLQKSQKEQKDEKKRSSSRARSGSD